ncbi:diphosphomevalonate/mevalonate 3,5-bisphosphate decarboxylase family protein [Aquimarina agarivorans]|uniref:diphosphomevalonate/mevalonate 3,5-bisphosphate decarboxylase family protein n=1 Tax=Aquimarina agarivorans TaxID=980584 RepID=UPI000248E6E9|nr:diphosphomevalonate decarboxylase [Aquimarina agarivorans]
MSTTYKSIGSSYNKKQGKVAFAAPSNIALVKYWGKRPVQLPENASLSFTLNVCRTETAIAYKKRAVSGNDFSITFLFEGAPKPSFVPKIHTFFERIAPYCLFLKDFEFIIDSKNTFPHSSGIASSASGMSALAMCLVEIECELGGLLSAVERKEKASFLARLGSGSACRSIEGPVTIWGKHQIINKSSNEFAVPFEGELHPIFRNYQDTVLLIDKGEKQVSSTVGHNLMYGHPFAKARFEQANANLEKLNAVLQNGDMDQFIEIVESEALTLHAMMMTSLPYFILMKSNTLEVINAIWNYRKASEIPVCFTLDAGANVHVLYPERHKKEVMEFINEELAEKCQNKQYICDNLGFGAKKL